MEQPDWNTLLAQNPSPSILDAIEFVSATTGVPMKKLSATTLDPTTLAMPLPPPPTEIVLPPEVMAKPKMRVRIVQDSHPSDPREDMDLMCEIAGDFDWRRSMSTREHLAHLISDTKGYQVACQMIDAAYTPGNPDGVDYPDLYDDEVRQRWLDLLAETELKTCEFSTQSYTYIAHTTPEMCAKLGVDWANAEKAMEGEVETFKQWAEGDVYGFIVEQWVPSCSCSDCDAGEWEETDSCWGFYGSDPFENGMSEHVEEELHDMLRAAEVEY